MSIEYQVRFYKEGKLIEINCAVEPIYDTDDSGFDDFDLWPIITDDMPITEATDLIQMVVDWKASLVGEAFDTVLDEITELARLDNIDKQVHKAELSRDINWD